MWLDPSVDWLVIGRDGVGHLASAAVVALLYVAQAVILARVLDDRSAWSIYAVIVAVSIPLLWGFSPLWHHPQCGPLATYVGWPVTVHPVPLWSFAKGLALRRTGRLRRWRWVILVHIVVVLPVWYFVWGFVELFCLGFAWI